MDEGRTEGGREAQVDGGPLVEVLTGQVTYLRTQLDHEREARCRADTIIAQLTPATSNLTDRLRELELPAQYPAPSQRSETAQESPGAPESVVAEPERAEPRPAAGGAQEGAARVSWWRKVFGG